MEYRSMDKLGVKPSLLGFGCMRFPLREDGHIDEAEAEKMLDKAIASGVNYIDTAYPYHNGDSEPFVGRVLKKYDRGSLYLATKLPVWKVETIEDVKETFQEQLNRLQVDYVDFYLLHALSKERWDKILKLGILDYCEELRSQGKIKYLGFSFHDSYEVFEEILTYRSWDFCQIQYNYMDENTQAGRRGLQYAASRGLPVIIMEPLRGGKLVNHLPKEAEMLFDTYPVKHTPADWAFRWLWNQPEVTCVLSGMNSREMVEENVKTASEVSVGEFGPGEEEMLQKVVQAVNAKMKVGCTGCGYCMPCPKNVDIPGTFAAYNRRYSEGKNAAFTEYFMCTAMRRTSSAASNCIECGKCEKHCPQHIEIRKELKNARRQLEGPVYKIGRKIVSLFKLY